MRYLTDTDWAIEYLKNVPPTIERLNTMFPEGVGLRVVSLAELYDGVFGSDNRQSDERRLHILFP